ncbi:MAG: pilus assembly protein Flp/PilA [Bacillota bacterium]|nr:MAG: pilus assembly protein Flp/PilA [Bacillota bacterium]MBS3949395.1 Flp family type IVb pilin [Peptococcaceae bacterium]
MNLISRLLKEESGQGMVEYGLIIAAVAVVAIVGLGFFGEGLSEFFNNLRTELGLSPVTP